MDPNRKQWNEDFKQLRHLFGAASTLEEGKALFRKLHAPLHARAVSGQAGWNVEEELWQGLDEVAFRMLPAGEEHTIAWSLWHLARIEDMTMNVLLAGQDQVFEREGWADRLHSPLRDSGNEITPEKLLDLSQQVDWQAMRAYRSAVGASTRKVVEALSFADLKRKTPPEHLAKILAEGAINPDSTGVLAYWAGLTGKGLLLMPPTRHNFHHLNECLTLKRKAQKTRL
jgi:hypothetical protein